MKIAVLGLGSIGLRHAENLLALGRDVVGFDPDPAQRALLDELGGRGCGDREAAFDGAVAAVIATPNALHRDDIAAAIEAGVHLLVEKPFAHSLEGLEDLLDRAAGKGLVVAAAFNLRFRSVVRAMKRVIDEGRLGALLWGRFLCASYLPDWRPDQDYRVGYADDPVSGGVLFDVIHEFDLANHLLGPAETLCAAAGNSGHLEIQSEDTADVILAHECGIRSTLHLDYVTRPRRRVAEIAGTEGLLQADLRGGRLTLTGPDDTVVLDETHPLVIDAEYRAEIEDFLTAIENRGAPCCDGRAALAVLRQVIAARRLAGLPTAQEQDQ